MKLSHRLAEYVRACFTGIWIESFEHQDALSEITQLCRKQQWQLASWDIASGLQLPGQTEVSSGNNDPLAAIRAILHVLRQEMRPAACGMDSKTDDQGTGAGSEDVGTNYRLGIYRAGQTENLAGDLVSSRSPSAS